MNRWLLATAALAAAIPGLAYAAADAAKGGVKLSATLTGSAEVPGPGDADGAGTFSARVNPGQQQVCYTLSWSNLAPATMAHIHIGAAGVAGGVLVALKVEPDDNVTDCVALPRDKAMELIQNPSGFYVNVHTGDHPGGAIRGQLAKG